MRDQTWKVLQYSILFFLGVVGLEIKGVDSGVLIASYIAVFCTGMAGTIIAIHHRWRENEKLEMIKIYERELGLDVLIKPVLDKAHKNFLGMSTTAYIVAMQLSVSAVSLILLVKRIMA